MGYYTQIKCDKGKLFWLSKN